MFSAGSMVPDPHSRFYARLWKPPVFAQKFVLHVAFVAHLISLLEAKFFHFCLKSFHSPYFWIQCPKNDFLCWSMMMQGAHYLPQLYYDRWLVHWLSFLISLSY